ncbi:TolC family protein [Aquimarina addita]|uniref:TolC family protein n=1 Tax=Aquimarina addita TaxID=870485 RepID=A0ABP7XCS7_9FLAO
MNIRIQYLILLLILSISGYGQSEAILQEEILSFEEYLGYVKQQHPLIKQAELTLSVGEANLLKARGGFDPKIEVDYDRKKFKGTEYYDELNAAFKIPTWYGIEFKANFEENSGTFLNPNLTVPDDGLYSAGVSFSLAQGFLMNDRMATLKKAKFFREQTKAERDLQVNTLIFEASKVYFEWLEATNEQRIYETFLANANQRFIAIKRSVEVGDKAAIDSVEAKITFQNRRLSLEAARLKRRKATLKASNYLWINNIPMEIQEYVTPVIPDQAILESSLKLTGITNTASFLENHPKLRAMDNKIESLNVDRSLKRNKLLPRLDLQYNFLNTEYDQISTFNTANYKAALTFSVPLFLRKERGDLKLSNLKIQDANFQRASEALTIQNKIEAMNAEIASLELQNDLVDAVVQNYTALVMAEERKFALGESSLFLINSREGKLIDAQLKENQLQVKLLTSNAGLYNALGLTEDLTVN